MKKNEQTRDVREIVLTHVKAQIDSLFVKAVGNYVKQ